MSALVLLAGLCVLAAAEHMDDLRGILAALVGGALCVIGAIGMVR